MIGNRRYHGEAEMAEPPICMAVRSDGVLAAQAWLGRPILHAALFAAMLGSVGAAAATRVAAPPSADRGADANGDGVIEILEMRAEARRFVAAAPFDQGKWSVSMRTSSTGAVPGGKKRPGGRTDELDFPSGFAFGENARFLGALHRIKLFSDLKDSEIDGSNIRGEGVSIQKFRTSGGIIDVDASDEDGGRMRISGTYGRRQFGYEMTVSEVRRGKLVTTTVVGSGRFLY